MTSPAGRPREQGAVQERAADGLRAVAISGSPRSPSKSKALAQRMLDELVSLGCATQLIDVAHLPADALVVRGDSAETDDAIACVGAAHIVVAASPTYRALYTGVLKCFFDLMSQGHLAGKICVGLQTGGVPQHALAPEYGFRPLFASLDGVPWGMLYATDDQFAEGQPGDVLGAKIAELARNAVRAATGLR